MTQYIGDIKTLLYKEYVKETPTPSELEIKGFVRGMVRLEDALAEEGIEERLNDFVPVKNAFEKANRELEKTIQENEALKKKVKGLQAIIDNYNTLSKKELGELRMNSEFNRIKKELEEHKKFKDLYYSQLLGMKK